MMEHNLKTISEKLENYDDLVIELACMKEELQNLKLDYSTLDEPSRTRCLELIAKIEGA